jgi:hypothetical protein
MRPFDLTGFVNCSSFSQDNQNAGFSKVRAVIPLTPRQFPAERLLKFIREICNAKLLHSTLGYISPAEFETYFAQ